MWTVHFAGSGFHFRASRNAFYSYTSSQPCLDAAAYLDLLTISGTIHNEKTNCNRSTDFLGRAARGIIRKRTLAGHE